MVAPVRASMSPAVLGDLDLAGLAHELGLEVRLAGVGARPEVSPVLVMEMPEQAPVLSTPTMIVRLPLKDVAA